MMMEGSGSSATAIEHGSEDAAPLIRTGSGGSSGISSALPVDLERLGIVLSGYTERISLDTLRPLPTFLGVTGPAFCIAATAFAPPTKKLDKDAAEKIGSRLRLNFAYFLTNYALILAGTAFVVALMHPSMLVLMGILVGLWHVHFLLDRAAMPIEYGGVDLGEIFTASRRSLVLTILTVLVGVFKCLVPTLEVLAISGIAIFAHASMRDPQHVETCGDFGGGGGSRRRANSDADEEFVLDGEGHRESNGSGGIGGGMSNGGSSADSRIGMKTPKGDRSGELIRRDVV
eukprot:CAMPEP_0197719032 /NCGR_PEP_ID=MMETSP1434-20131217/2947_1 /TAXON_ID=265543 /ORGANISM="Minutocellus polymorphus, Strain CCMP3303" /LENGTH=287 /DNA_ID=CAMNT_0043303737 /DNA_START=9 /DNA_END=872 /DNA_ORIENTATION=-